MKKVITHELCHVFNNKINKNILMWIDEGSAQFIAKQKKKRDFTKENWDFFINNLTNKKMDLNSFSKNNGYKISYWLINKIVNKFGKDILLELIKTNNNREKKIEKIVEKIMPPSF